MINNNQRVNESTRGFFRDIQNGSRQNGSNKGRALSGEQDQLTQRAVII